MGRKKKVPEQKAEMSYDDLLELAKMHNIKVPPGTSYDDLEAILKNEGIREKTDPNDRGEESVDQPNPAIKPIGIPDNAALIECSDSEANKYQSQGKLAGGGNGKWWVIPALLVFLFTSGIPVADAALDGTEISVMTNFDQDTGWKVDSGGDLVPVTDSTNDIGETGTEVNAVYTDELVLGGSSITGVSQITTPMEDAGTYTRPIDAGDNIQLYDAGNLTIVGEYTGDAINLENGGKFDNASDNAITMAENSDTVTFSFTGDDLSIDNSDGGVIFALTDATDGTVDIQTNNDTDDYIQISTSSNQSTIDFVGQNGKITAASGTIDFDNENLTTTGTASLGATTATSFLVGDDTIDVVTDDEMRFASNDESSTIEAYGFEAKDAIVLLTADQSDDNGDEWQMVSNQSDNTFTLENDSTGSFVAKITVGAATGNTTVAGTLTSTKGITSTDGTFTAIQGLIGNRTANDATFSAISITNATFGTVQGTPLCYSDEGPVGSCGYL